MDLQEFEQLIKERADALVERVLADKETMTQRYEAKKADPTLMPWTNIEIDSRLRFDIAMQPHTLVGDEYFTTDKYDDVMERIRLDSRQRLGQETYKELW